MPRLSEFYGIVIYMYSLVEQWRRLHVEALMANWDRAQEPAALTSVEPLQ